MKLFKDGENKTNENYEFEGNNEYPFGFDNMKWSSNNNNEQENQKENDDLYSNSNKEEENKKGKFFSLIF